MTCVEAMQSTKSTTTIRLAKMAAQIMQFPEIERLSPRVIRVMGGNPGKFTLQGTNTYIVGTGPCRLLIDTGEGRPSWMTAIKKALQEENISISETILTHWHGDHVGGQEHLQELSPETKFYKNTPSDGQLDIKDGQTFQVEGATLRTIHSPGHTQDHMALILEEEDAMFTGDNVLGYGTAVFEDLGTYLSSLEKMRGVFKGRAYPGHGPEIKDGPSKILEYIRHRKMREDQVIQVLKSGKGGKGVAVGEPNAWTSMEIVKVVYKDVPENLHIPANGGVMQILTKLEGEEKIVQDETTERWRIRDRATL